MVDLSAIPDDQLDAMINAQNVSSAILGQESNNNPNAATSVDGAIGPGQIEPGTFAQFAKPGEDINNAEDNIAVHNRIIADLSNKANGDPARIAVGYFSGPGNIAPADSPTPWKSDRKDGNGKLVSSYVNDVLKRLNPVSDANASEPMVGKKPSISAPDKLSALSDDEIDAQIAKLSNENSRSEPGANDTSRGRTMLEQGLQGATFGLADEVYDPIGAGIASVATGEKYNDLLDEARNNTKQRLSEQMQERPALSIGSQLGGALITGGAGGTTKAGAALSGGLRSGAILGRDLGLAGRAAKAGAVGSAAAGVSGFNSGSGFENRIENGADSLGPGFLVGAALPVAGQVLSKTLGKPIEGAANTATRRIASGTGEISDNDLPSKAVGKVYDRMNSDYSPADLPAVLNKYASTDGQSLLEAGGPRTANLAEGAAQYPSGNASASEFFDKAVGEAPDKLKTSAANNISPSTNYFDTLDDIVKSGREKAAPLYQQAFQKNQVINSPVINRILQTPEGKSALSDAARNMQNEMSLLSKPDPDLTAMSQEVGNAATGVGVGNGLKLKTLDYVKKSMDDSINKAYRTGDDAEARRVVQLKNGLLKEIDSADQSGLYAKARKASGDYLSNRDAIEAGTTFLRDDPQLIAQRFNAYGPTEQQAYKVGVLKTIRNDIDNKVDGQNVARLFSKPASRQKLSSILSPSEFDSLRGDAQNIDNIYKLRNQVIGNSRTAGRQIAADEFNDDTTQLVTDIATKGASRALMDRGVSAITRQFDGLNDNSAKDVANILYETDPKKKYVIVKNLTNLAKTNNPRGLQAASKLKAFYSLSDGITAAKNSGGSAAVPAGNLVGNKPTQDLPYVDLPKVSPQP